MKTHCGRDLKLLILSFSEFHQYFNPFTYTKILTSFYKIIFLFFYSISVKLID